jgi:hypothetical protein
MQKRPDVQGLIQTNPDLTNKKRAINFYPIYYIKDTCVRCHSYWSQNEAEYHVDAIQN